MIIDLTLFLQPNVNLKPQGSVTSRKMRAMSLIGPEAQAKHTVGAQDLKLTTHTEQLAVSPVFVCTLSRSNESD